MRLQLKLMREFLNRTPTTITANQMARNYIDFKINVN